MREYNETTWYMTVFGEHTKCFRMLVFDFVRFARARVRGRKRRFCAFPCLRNGGARNASWRARAERTPACRHRITSPSRFSCFGCVLIEKKKPNARNKTAVGKNRKIKRKRVARPCGAPYAISFRIDSSPSDALDNLSPRLMHCRAYVVFRWRAVVALGRPSKVKTHTAAASVCARAGNGHWRTLFRSWHARKSFLPRRHTAWRSKI